MDPHIQKRHKIEREFHNEWARHISPAHVKYKQAFQSTTATENRFAVRQIGTLKSKRLLDIGCGLGDASLYFASKGAHVCAIDISDGMIDVVKKASNHYGLSKKVRARVMVAEKLQFDDNYFDIVYGNGLLHHTQPQLTLEEVYRVLKPGGIAVFVEPLSHNPLINVYRRIATSVRTIAEKPFSYGEIERLTSSGKFSKGSHYEFHLSTLCIFLYFFLIERVSPNKERYWKKIINEGARIGKGFSFLYSLDQKILKRIPYLRRFCWNTVLVFVK